MPTPTEKRIIQSRATKKSGTLLVPILEELLEKPVEIEDEEDFRFMDNLIRARAVPRAAKVFSPSMLGSCVRQAYFSKRGEKKITTISPQTNGYFLNGNFVHLKWQFAVWKAHRSKMIEVPALPAPPSLDFYGNGSRPAMELRVVRDDFGGTIDVIVIIDGLWYIVDFKGINLIDFQRTVKHGAKIGYRRQIVGYGQIAQDVLSVEIAGCLLISECKAGPLGGRGNAIALHETLVSIDEFKGDVNRRLRTLRWYDSRDEIPEAECQSRNHMQFQECAFNRFCDAEVKAIQRERERRAAKRSGDWTPARPGR